MEASVVSTPEGLTYSIQITVGMSVTMKKPSARNYLSPFLELLNIKQKNAVHRMGAAKIKRKAIQTRSLLLSIIHKRRGHLKTNASVKKYFYHWILHHPQVSKYPIANN